LWTVLAFPVLLDFGVATVVEIRFLKPALLHFSRPPLKEYLGQKALMKFVFKFEFIIFCTS